MITNFQCYVLNDKWKEPLKFNITHSTFNIVKQ
jgi:hypothetical protein